MARVFTDAGAQKLISATQRLTNDLSFSVAFWLFRTATPAANRNIISACDITNPAGFIIRLLTTNLIQAAFPFTTTDKVRSSATAPALNTWVHVIVTHNNTGTATTDFTFYFNGKSEAGTTVSTGSGTHDQATPVAIEVGASAADATAAPPANIGPIAIWNRAISPAEASALASGEHPLRFKEGLIEIFDMATAAGEEGWLARLYLAQGATNPTSASGNPALLAPPGSQPGETHLNVRPTVRSRARYAVLSTGIAATNSQPLVLAGSAQTAVGVAAQASQPLAVGGSAQGAVGDQAQSAAALSVGGSATTAVQVAAASASQLALSGTAALIASILALSNQPIGLGGSASGVVGDAALSSIPLSLGGLAQATVLVQAQSAKQLGLSGLATVQSAIAAASSLPLTMSGVASAAVLVQAQSNQPLLFGGVVTGGTGTTVNATSAQSVGLSGLATAVVGDVAQSSKSLGLAGNAQAAVGIGAQSTRSVSLGGLANAAVLVQLTSVRALQLSSFGAAQTLVRASSLAQLALSGQAIAVHGEVVTYIGHLTHVASAYQVRALANAAFETRALPAAPFQVRRSK